MKKVINTAGVERTAACLHWLTGQNVPAWSSVTTYVRGDMARLTDNTLWRCILANTNHTPPNTTYWLPTDQHGERTVIMRDLYFLGPPIFYPNWEQGTLNDANYGAFPLVDGDSPIAFQTYQEIPNQSFNPTITFVPFSVEKDKLEYKTGFESSSIALTLRPRDPTTITTYNSGSISPYSYRGPGNPSFVNPPSFAESAQVRPPYADFYAHVAGNLYQTMRQSFAQNQDWYLAPLTMWRTFSPAEDPSDVTSYGAAVMFRGRVSSLQVDKEDVKLTVASLMEIFKQKVPTQTIQPGNRWAPFDPNGTEDFFTSTSPAVGGFNWITTLSTPQGATQTSDGIMGEGWALIEVVGAGIYWRKIYTNIGTFTSGGNQYTTVVFLENLPVNLTGFNVNMKIWVSSNTSTNPSGPGSGFPYVPQPLTGIS